jgi:hypothetical protein
MHKPNPVGSPSLLFLLSILCSLLGPARLHAQSFFAMGSGGTESRTTLTIKTDGSCALTNEAVQPRKTLEMQIHNWERYANMAETGGLEEEAAPIVATNNPAAKSLSNEELAAKLRNIYEQRPEFGEADAVRIDNVESSTNVVCLLTSRAFPSLKELLTESLHQWGPGVLMPEGARFEIDTNRNLRITFAGSENASRYAKTASRGWKSSKMKIEWRLVLPGRVLSSGLPGIEDKATWLKLDGEKPESVETALKLVGTTLVITAEAAGIKLDEPLESKKLARAASRRRKAEPELPVTDAAPGFLAEPVSITLSTTYHFPEGEKYFKDRPNFSRFGMEPSATIVSAKLFPPKGREIRSVSQVRVKIAKDDKGRALSAAAQDGEDEESYSEFSSFSSGDSEKTAAAHLEIRLALPAPDARSIEELECEAVALTIGGWKEMMLTNVQADATREIDLAEVLPGAKLIIKKIGGRKPQRTIEATLEGPPAVHQLELKTRFNSRQGGHSSSSDQRTATSGSKTIRNLMVQSFEFQMGEEATDSPLVLLVRYPQDPKRERVRFKLTALDLL